MNIKKVSIIKITQFTLIELLVVIGIIAIMAALLFPSLRMAKIEAKNIVCLNQIRQNTVAVLVYASDNSAKLLYTWIHEDIPKSPWKQQTNLITRPLNILDYFNVNSSEVFKCPFVPWGVGGREADTNSRVKKMTSLSPGERLVMGYEYLGGFKASPARPQNFATKLTDNPQSAIWADWNNTLDNKTVYIAHPKGKSEMLRIWDGAGGTPATLGSAGGNISHLDGSAAWYNISDLNNQFYRWNQSNQIIGLRPTLHN